MTRRLTVSLAVLLLLGGPVAAQSRSHIQAFGFDAVRGILNELQLKPLSSFDELRYGTPSRQLLIVFGSWIGADDRLSADELHQFVDRGGAVLYASDQRSDAAWDHVFDVRILGQRVFAGRPEDGYRNESQCPFVKPVVSAAVPVFVGVGRVATNLPSVMPPSDALPTLAVFPAGSFTPIGRLSGQAPFAVGGPLGNGGRAIILADHSVFVNEMMLQPDNGNFDFAYNCLTWLTLGRRTECLFISDSQIHGDFRVQFGELPAPPLPPLETLVPLVNATLAGLEDENVHNQLLLDLIRPSRLWRVLLVLLTLAITGLGLFALFRSRLRADPRDRPLDESLIAARRPLAVTDRRRLEMVTGANLYEPAREKARLVLTALGASPIARPQVAGGWKNRKLRQSANAAWRLAFGSEPVPVPPNRWTALRDELWELERAARDGVVTFDEAGRQA